MSSRPLCGISDAKKGDCEKLHKEAITVPLFCLHLPLLYVYACIDVHDYTYLYTYLYKHTTSSYLLQSSNSGMKPLLCFTFLTPRLQYIFK